MDLSVVIPLYNESESIEELNKWITNTLNSKSISFEKKSIFIFSSHCSHNIHLF